MLRDPAVLACVRRSWRVPGGPGVCPAFLACARRSWRVSGGPGIFHARTGPSWDASGVARRGVFFAKGDFGTTFNPEISDFYW